MEFKIKKSVFSTLTIRVVFLVFQVVKEVGRRLGGGGMGQF